jgi:hypothetical protein
MSARSTAPKAEATMFASESLYIRMFISAAISERPQSYPSTLASGAEK